MNVRVAVLAGALIGALLIVGGCGEVSDAEFRSSAERICKGTDAELSKIPAPAPEDLAGYGRYTDQVLPIIRRAHKRLGGVETPSNRKSEYKKWVGSVERAASLIESRGKAAKAGDRRIFDALVKQENTVVQESRAQAALLGLRQC